MLLAEESESMHGAGGVNVEGLDAQGFLAQVEKAVVAGAYAHFAAVGEGVEFQQGGLQELQARPTSANRALGGQRSDLARGGAQGRLELEPGKRGHEPRNEVAVAHDSGALGVELFGAASGARLLVGQEMHRRL